MDLKELYEKIKDTIDLNNPLRYEENYLIKFNCSQCGNELLEIRYLNGETKYKLPKEQKYLYFDGDTIDIHKSERLKADTTLMFGKCMNCHNQILLINAIVLDREIDRSELKNDYEKCFTVSDEENLVTDFSKGCQYAVFLENELIGKATYFKDAILNKKAIYGLKRDIKRDVVIVSLECLSENENMIIEDIGICNGHYENAKQYNVWKQSSFIAETIIQSAEKFIKENKKR